MNNEEILRKAIEKAEKNGWSINYYQPHFHSVRTKGFFGSKGSTDFFMNTTWNRYFGIIFSHKFAKAFWGQDLVTFITVTKDNSHDQVRLEGMTHVVVSIEENGGTIKMPAFLYHLQQMVISEEPLKYLEKFLV